VLPGVDLVYQGDQNQLRFDFHLAAGADLSQIEMNYEGADSVHVDGHGRVVLHTAGGDVYQETPTLYQDIGGHRQLVAGSYEMRGDGRVGFHVDHYDAGHELVLDPTLSYSTYLGGNSADTSRAVAVDLQGNMYVSGTTGSTNFPTEQPYQGSLSGSTDVFVTKFNARGDKLLYSTYLGGTGLETGYGLAVDAGGYAYVAGTTTSSNFPTTTGAFQTTISLDNNDAFVTRFAPAGNALVWSSFLGAPARTCRERWPWTRRARCT